MEIQDTRCKNVCLLSNEQNNMHFANVVYSSLLGPMDRLEINKTEENQCGICSK